MRTFSQKLYERVQFAFARSLPDSDISFSDKSLPFVIERLSKKYCIEIQREEAPVFILSAGWRSGSTLLQRLLVSSGDIFIWGEPYSETRPIQHQARNLCNFDNDHPEEHVCFANPGHNSQELARHWIANLYPTIQEYYDAHCGYLDQLFSIPAKKLGYNRWGLKEVRLDANHAQYLKWLYPRCRIVFLVRNPFDAWISYKGMIRKTGAWYWERPSLPVSNLKQFMSIWGHIVCSFLEQAEQLSALLVSHDNLINDTRVIESVEKFTSLSVDRSILGVKKGGTKRRSILNRYEHNYIKRYISRNIPFDITNNLGF